MSGLLFARRCELHVESTVHVDSERRVVRQHKKYAAEGVPSYIGHHNHDKPLFLASHPKKAPTLGSSETRRFFSAAVAGLSTSQQKRMEHAGNSLSHPRLASTEMSVILPTWYTLETTTILNASSDA